MCDTLLQDIFLYIEHLKKNNINVSFRLLKNILWNKDLAEFAQYDIHDNEFCRLVKNNPQAYKKCMECQNRVFDNPEKTFFGMCHAGIEEYVFPVYVGNDILGSISVGEYAINASEAHMRLKKISKMCNVSYNELANRYDEVCIKELPELSELKSVVNPLCHMLSMLAQRAELKRISYEENTSSYIFSEAVKYMNMNFDYAITLDKISEYCSCSSSTLERCFQKETGQTAMRYLKIIRMKHAKDLVLKTNMPVKSIAAMVGFSEPDYFSTAFREYYKISPTKMRSKSNLMLK